jgi:hypothetical protein
MEDLIKKYGCKKLNLDDDYCNPVEEAVPSWIELNKKRNPSSSRQFVSNNLCDPSDSQCSNNLDSFTSRQGNSTTCNPSDTNCSDKIKTEKKQLNKPKLSRHVDGKCNPYDIDCMNAIDKNFDNYLHQFDKQQGRLIKICHINDFECIDREEYFANLIPRNNLRIKYNELDNTGPPYYVPSTPYNHQIYDDNIPPIPRYSHTRPITWGGRQIIGW